jgi:hypothetical protein
MLAITLSPDSVKKNKDEVWPTTVTIHGYGGDYGEIEYEIEYVTEGVVSTAGISEATHIDGIFPGSSETIVPEFKCQENGSGNYGVHITGRFIPPEPEWEPSLNDLLGDCFFGYDYHRPEWEIQLAEQGDEKILEDEIYVWGCATCGTPTETPPPVSEGESEEPEQPTEIPSCELTFNPDPCYFGDVCVGASKQTRVTLTNNCEFDISIEAYKWPGAPFEIISTVPQDLVLTKGQSYDYNIEFTPPHTTFYSDLFSISASYKYQGQKYYMELATNVAGTGIACAQTQSAMSIEGWPQCTPSATGSTMDFQMLVKDTTDGEALIKEVILYIDGEQAYSSGVISAIEFPPPPGIIFRRETIPGPHTIRVVVIDASGQESEQLWEVYCEGEPTEQPPVSDPPETIPLCPDCGNPVDQCTCQ